MEGTEGHDVVDDIELELSEVVEDNVFDNEDIDIDYDVVDGNFQELGDVGTLNMLISVR